VVSRPFPKRTERTGHPQVVVWEGPATRLSFSTRLDFLTDDSNRIQPGATIATTTVIPLIKSEFSGLPEAPVNISGRPTFAESADGARSGPNIEKMKTWLAGERTLRIDEYRRLAKILQGGGENALHQALMTPDTALTETGRSVRNELARIKKTNGMAAVIETIKKRNVKIPD